MTQYADPFKPKKQNADSLVIWHRNGDTGLFKKVTDFYSDGATIKFKYHGKSTNTDR